MGVLQGDRQSLMSPCLRSLLSSDWIPLRASGFKQYCLFHGCFSPGLSLIFIGGTFLYFLASREAKLQDPLVLKFLGGGLREYFDTQQVDLLGLLIDTFFVQILYLLGLYPVLRIYCRLPLWLRG